MSAATGQAQLVGMAELHVSKAPQKYLYAGLGSCVGVAAYDPLTGVSGSAHIMLPNTFKEVEKERLAKFADTGLYEMLKAMEDLGALRMRIRLALAGGAQVFKFGSGDTSRLDIGARNAATLHEIITKDRLNLIAHDLGGNLGRTVTFDSSTGIVHVRTLTLGEKVLCNLKP